MGNWKNKKAINQGYVKNFFIYFIIYPMDCPIAIIRKCSSGVNDEVVQLFAVLCEERTEEVVGGEDVDELMRYSRFLKV